MFTCIILKLGKFVSLRKGSSPLFILEIDFEGVDVKIGDSVAVNGSCLTVVEKNGNHYHFNLSGETLKLSNFADLSKNSVMNIELPLTLQDFLSGHLVSGHLDGVVRVKGINKKGGSLSFTFVFQDGEWKKFLVNKGSVAINGVSLTISRVMGSSFSVEVIPHTLNHTNLKTLRIGDRVNIELDLIGKYLYNLTPLKRIK